MPRRLPASVAHPLVLFGSIVLGLGLSFVHSISVVAELVIVPALIGMLYFVLLDVPASSLRRGFKNRRLALSSLLINFGLTPLFAWALGWLFLSEHPDIWLGLIMLLVMPCTDWYLVFTGVARGDVPSCLAILPWNLTLQLVLLPLYLLVLAGTFVSIDLRVVVWSIVLVLGVPAVLVVLTRYTAPSSVVERLTGIGENAQLYLLGLAICAMFASQGHVLLSHIHLMMNVLVPLMLFFSTMLLIGLSSQRVLGLGYGEMACLTMTTSARNSPLSLAIALVAFADHPFVAITLVVGALIEIPVLTLMAHALLLLRPHWSPS
ncbi:MAG: arsenic resistance protein [Methermicoccaceae archaeon]